MKSFRHHSSATPPCSSTRQDRRPSRRSVRAHPVRPVPCSNNASPVQPPSLGRRESRAVPDLLLPPPYEPPLATPGPPQPLVSRQTEFPRAAAKMVLPAHRQYRNSSTAPRPLPIP